MRLRQRLNRSSSEHHRGRFGARPADRSTGANLIPRRLSTLSSRRKPKPCNDNRNRCRQESQPRFQSHQQFSVVAVTNQSGTIKERYAYTAYGVPTFCNASGTDVGASAEGNRYTYTGREWDEIAELYHFRARPYGALCGRFLSRDPIGYLGGDENLFRYASGHPTCAGDPLGLWDIEWEGEWIQGDIFIFRAAFRRIEERLHELLRQLDREIELMSDCERSELKYELRRLRTILECMIAGFDSNDELEVYLYDFGPSDTQVRGRSWPATILRDPSIAINDGAVFPNWLDGDLDSILLHELSHLCGTTHGARRGHFNNAHLFDLLIDTDLNSHSRFRIWKEHLGLKCTNDPRCPPTDPYHHGPRDDIDDWPDEH